MTEWEPATESEAAMRDALRANDQELYFRILARAELLLPVSADALAGRTTMGWGTWNTAGRTHVLAFTSSGALTACLAESASSARRVPFDDLANNWPNLEWWLAVNPGLPIEGYLPAWFVTQLARGDVRLPGRTIGARARLERVEQAARARATAAVPPRSGQPEPGPAGSSQPGPAESPVSPAPAHPVLPAHPTSPAPAFTGPVPPTRPVSPSPLTRRGGLPPAREDGAAPSLFEKPPRPTSPAFGGRPGPRQNGDQTAPSGPWSATSNGGSDPAAEGGAGADRAAPATDSRWLARPTSPAPTGPAPTSPAPAFGADSRPPGDPARAPHGGEPAAGPVSSAQTPSAVAPTPSSGERPTAGGWLPPQPRSEPEPPAAGPGTPQPPAAADAPGRGQWAAESAQVTSGWLAGRASTVERPIVSTAQTATAQTATAPTVTAPTVAAADLAGNDPTAAWSAVAEPAPGGRPTANDDSSTSVGQWNATMPADATPAEYAGEPAPETAQFGQQTEASADPDSMTTAVREPEPEPAPPAVDPALRDFIAANSVEESLAEAARAGNTDSFLSTLLLAKVLLPTSTISVSGTKPGEPGFAWHTENLEDETFVVVFTSPERLAEHATEAVETVEVKFVQLIRKWPDDAWSFAINPGTPVGAKLPGTQIVALASWAAEVGLGTDEAEPTESPAADESTPRSTYAPAREDPNRPTMMQKTIAPSQVAYYLDRGYDRVSGFVHRANEVAHLTSPAKLHAALGLGYPASPFTRDTSEVYVLRWPAHRPSLYRIPYGGQSESAMRAMEGWVIERAPFRGNGFAPGDSSDVIAEFKVDSARLPHGAQLWKISVEGGEELVATLDSDAPAWRKTGES